MGSEVNQLLTTIWSPVASVEQHRCPVTGDRSHHVPSFTVMAGSHNRWELCPVLEDMHDENVEPVVLAVESTNWWNKANEAAPLHSGHGCGSIGAGGGRTVLRGPRTDARHARTAELFAWPRRGYRGGHCCLDWCGACGSSSSANRWRDRRGNAALCYHQHGIHDDHGLANHDKHHTIRS